MIDYINWWEENKEVGLEDVKKIYLGLFDKAEFLPSIYHPLLYKYLKNSQLKHWDNEIFLFSKNKIEEIKTCIGKDNMLSTLLSNFHLLIYTYESLLDIEERITMMNRFKGSEELKAKVFNVNIYNDLLNIAFSNSLKLFIQFQSVVEDRNLFQKNLAPQIDCLASEKRGFSPITDLADSNIRNAISHGGVKINGSKMVFSYRKGAKFLEKESTVYDFKDSLLQLYDGISAIVLSWISYFCEDNITYSEIYRNELVHEDTKIFFEKLSVSTLCTVCDKINQIEIVNESSKRQHVNIEYAGIDLDIDSRAVLGLCTAERIFQLRELSIEDSIMVSFRSPRVANSFFTVNCSIIYDLANGNIDLQEAWKRVMGTKNILMFPINDESRNKFEDSFRYYPDIETEDYRITEIEDISLEDKKRFKAVVYLKRAKRRNHVKLAVKEIVKQVKILENYGFTSNRVKHGNMEADILYLVLYRKELRRGKDRALFPTNNNFIAQVQYDVDMNFPIRNVITDSKLKRRCEKEIEYNWNPNF
ncbi:hypothetical protein NGH88_09315 [Enterococcus faecalis]|uniref:hypothetical protein n=1 Tax=Enterococcus faecalis TaxID=1351 RepID=UPI002DB61480|nr:hypothetical protein [Enterococcus faecalis]MEB7921283.1 hypothetical protein [Enterococcus faecalis]